MNFVSLARLSASPHNRHISFGGIAMHALLTAHQRATSFVGATAVSLSLWIGIIEVARRVM
jgi:hypothetical protein